MDASILSHLIGPGPIKAGLEVVDHIVPGSTRTFVEGIEHFQNSPAYIHHRVEQAQDFWDDHKEDVEEFFDNVGDTISEGWDSFTEGVGDIAEGIGDAISEHGDDILDAVGGFIGGLFS